MRTQTTTTRRPAPLPPMRADLLDGRTIIERMLADLNDAPALAPQDAVIDRDFFLNLGWTRQQVAAYGPRAIERFRA